MMTRENISKGRRFAAWRSKGGVFVITLFTLLSLGVLGSGCGGSGGGWYSITHGPDCQTHAHAGANASNGDFHNCNLNNLDLTGANYSFADFTDADLSFATGYTPGSPFGPIDFEEAVMRNVDLSFVVMDYANLVKADLRGDFPFSTNLLEAGLDDANLRQANLVNAFMKKAHLKGATLKWANLNGADLTQADLEFANLDDADLRNANLAGANLANASTVGTLFSPSAQALLTPGQWADRSLTGTPDIEVPIP